jgi:ribosomal protein S18 acetylase RimI-like enzyme
MMKTKSGFEFDVVVYDDRHFEGVEALWRAAPLDITDWRAPEISIPAKIAVQRELFLVAAHGDRVIGTTMAGYDGHRGWLYSVAVLPAYRRDGIGSALIQEAENRLLAMGCPKINLQVVAANISVTRFYEKLGYAIEERISMSKPLGAFARSRHGAPAKSRGDCARARVHGRVPR